MSQIRPSFFIIGAPKSGTTALSEYLNEHENIVVSKPKEPHYFALDMPKMRGADTESDYLKMFDHTEKPKAKLACDASVWYLFSKVAVENIKAWDPNSKIIIMLRRPDQMVYSMHSQQLCSTDENIKSFEKAWNLNEDRAQGKSVPNFCRAPQKLDYSQIAKYSEQIERVYKFFPKKQVKIILFDDFKKDAKVTYEQTLDFLGLPQNHKNDFPVINENTENKSSFLKRLLITHPPAPIRLLKNSFKKVVGKQQLGFDSWFKRVNTRTKSRNPLSEDIRQEVIQTYKDDIIKLSSLIERDLSHWLT